LTQAALKVLAGCIIASLLPCVPVDVQNPGHCTPNRTLTTLGLLINKSLVRASNAAAFAAGPRLHHRRRLLLSPRAQRRRVWL